MADPRAPSHGIDDARPQRVGDDDDARARVVEDEFVVSGRPERVDRNRHGADLDRAEEAVDHLRRIEHQQQDALFRTHAEPLAKRRAHAIDLFVQLTGEMRRSPHSIAVAPARPSSRCRSTK